MDVSTAPPNIELVEKVTSDFSHLALSAPLSLSEKSEPAPYLVPPLPAMTAQDRFNRWTPIGTITPVGPTAGTLITTISSAGYFSVPSIAEAVRTASGFVGDFEVMITSSVPAGCSGSFLATVTPQCGNTDILATNSEFPEDKYFSAFQRTHAMIHCSSASNVYLPLPYTAPKAYSLFTEPQALIQFWCVAPPIVATDGSAANTQFQIYMRAAPNFCLVNPSAQSSTGAHPMLTYARGASSVLRKTANTIDAVSKIILDGNSMVPADGTSTRMFDSYPTLSQMDGVDISQTLAPTSRSGKAKYETPAQLDEVVSRWTHLASLDWSTTAAAGTVLGTFPVTPFSDFLYDVVNPYLLPSPASVIGMGSRYWRATLKYRVYIPASSFHRGVLQVVWYPGTSYTASARDPTNIAPNVLFEVEAAKIMDITVGFAATTPVLPVFHTSAYTGAASYNAYGSVNGFLEFRIATRLSAPTASPLKVVVLMSVCDYELFGQSSNIPTESFSWPYYGVRVSAGTVGDNADSIIDVVLVPRAPRLGASMAGYSIESINAVLQQYQIAHVANSFGVSTTGFAFSTGNSVGERTAFATDVNMQITNTDYPSTIPTLGDLILSMFCGWQGTQRFAFAVANVSAGYLNFCQDAPFYNSTSSSRADALATYTGLNHALGDNISENIYISAPFLSTDTFAFSGSRKTSSIQDSQYVFMVWEGDTIGASARFLVWKGYGSDISPVMFRTTTRLRLYSNTRYPST